jgi:hypothetical protein
VMKTRELVIAAHSEAVSLPEGDADELLVTMVTPLSHSPAPLLTTVKVLVQLLPRYIGGNGVDVLADTCAAELAPIGDGTRGGGCPQGAGLIVLGRSARGPREPAAGGGLKRLTSMPAVQP